MRKLTQVEYVERSNNRHQNKYSCGEYHGSTAHIEITCPEHGMFTAQAHAHMKGSGCPKCVGNLLKTTETFIASAQNRHGSRFDYSEVNYTGAFNKVIISCRIHGRFKQVAKTHLTTNGCPYCSKKARVSFSEFVSRATIQHDDRYYYHEETFDNILKKTKIICKEHGDFWQTPNNHFAHKQGCPKCKPHFSRKETDFLNSIGLPNDEIHRQKKINLPSFSKRPIYVDGFDPKTNTVYEFHGDFWHGNPLKYRSDDINPVSKKTFGEHYNITKKREEALRTAGFNVVSIWESDVK